MGTPRAEIESIFDAPLIGLSNGSFDAFSLDALTQASFNHGDFALQFNIPESIPSDSSLDCQWNEQPTVFSHPNECTTEHQAMDFASTPSAVVNDDGKWHSSDHEMIEETLQILLQQFDARGGRGHGDLILALEPVTSGAETQFQSSAPKDLSNYLKMCVYLASNNLLAEASIKQLVSLIAITNSHSRLKALIETNSTSNEIFMSTLLASAAALGDTKICQILIEAGADLDALSGMTTRRTPLRQAIQNMHTQCTKMLLEAGADSNLVVEKDTPLHSACLYSHSQPALDIVNHLIRHGAQVNPSQDCARLTPLQLAAEAIEPEILKLLLDKGADPNGFTTSTSGTALQMACKFSYNANMVEILMNAGADIDNCSEYKFPSRDGDSSADSDKDSSLNDWPSRYGLPDALKPPILIAAEEDNWEAVQLLLEEGAAINIELKNCPSRALEKELDAVEIAVFTPLQAAVRAENITMTRMLLVNGADVNTKVKGNHGHTALQIAAMVGNERLFGILLRKGADINSSAGVYRGRTALQAAATHSDTKILSLLLGEGADVNAPPARFHGRTAIQRAVAAGNIEGVRMLLDAGAIVNTDPDLTEGVTCLQVAFEIADQAVKNEVIHILLRAGASVGAPKPGQQRHVPLHAAVSNKDLKMARKLLERGANPNPNIAVGNFRNKKTPLQEASSLGDNDLIQELIKHGAEVNASPYPYGGRTALQAASEKGHESTAKILLSFGAAIKAERAEINGISAIEASLNPEKFGLTQILLDREPDAISSDPVTSCQVIGKALSFRTCNVALLELLIKAGADVGKAPNSASRSYLQRAAAMGNLGMVQCLISVGTNINHRWKTTSRGEVTALQSAVASRNIDIVELLLQRGADVNAPANEHGGQTALQIAASQNNHIMVKLLRGYGADVNGLPSPIRGRSALQEAASRGSMQLTKYLLVSGADPNLLPARFGGATALQGAAIEGNIRIVIMLLQAGAFVNAAPAVAEGRSAIEGAAENGRLDTLRLLLKHHPDTEEFDIRRKRAARMALSNGHLAIGRFLMAYRKHARKA